MRKPVRNIRIVPDDLKLFVTAARRSFPGKAAQRDCAPRPFAAVTEHLDGERLPEAVSVDRLALDRERARGRADDRTIRRPAQVGDLAEECLAHGAGRRVWGRTRAVAEIQRSGGL